MKMILKKKRLDFKIKLFLGHTINDLDCLDDYHLFETFGDSISSYLIKLCRLCIYLEFCTVCGKVSETCKEII